jgi:flagellar biosynthesis chaperone FliJ
LLSIEKLRKFRERAAAAALAASRASGQSAADAVTSFEGELVSHSAFQQRVEASLYEKALATVMTDQQMNEMSQRIQEGRQKAVSMGERLLQLKVQAMKAAAGAEIARLKYAASLRSCKKWEKLRERIQKQAALEELRRDEGASLDPAISTNEMGSSAC